jgi:transposase
MHQSNRYRALVPVGLIIERVDFGVDYIGIVARSAAKSCACPRCGKLSSRVHSRYQRSLADLPAHGKAVRISLIARRFRCQEQLCRTRIFTERLDRGIALSSARRTVRLECIVRHLGLALGGRPAASLARRLMLPVSKDTLLRVVRRSVVRRDTPLNVIGIDDWAWKRGHRYGTLICDLERRRIVDLLPDRETATAEAWLAAHPSITVVARDRGGGYRRAAERALPGAVQVADRWHLMENASSAFLLAVRKSLQAIRQALGTTMIDVTLLTKAELRQYEGFLRRQEANAVIRALADMGTPIKEIVRRTGHSRQTIRQVVRGGGARTDAFRSRMSSLEPYLARLDADWSTGCHNGVELWRRLKAEGFRGGLRVVTEWATRRRRSESNPTGRPNKIPSARTIAHLMTFGRDRLSKDEAITVATIEGAVPALVAARDRIDQFHAMIRRRATIHLDEWISCAADGLLSSFATGISTDRQAVAAAITEPWSNGQTEGQITKLKLVKRQMYGRGKLDLLRARLLGAA